MFKEEPFSTKKNGYILPLFYSRQRAAGQTIAQANPSLPLPLLTHHLAQLSSRDLRYKSNHRAIIVGH